MLPLGQYAVLQVLRPAVDGLWLGRDGHEALLARREVSRELSVGDEVRVFLYGDSEDRVFATFAEPLAVVGSFACLECVAVTSHGAFLNWGLPKDLFVPRGRLQHQEMQVGRSYVVWVLTDERTGRVYATSALGKYLDFSVEKLQTRAEVSLMVYGLNDVGAQVIVDGRYAGIVYATPQIARPRVGDVATGWIQRIRDDGRLDISLKPLGREGMFDAQVEVVAALMAADGFLPLHDRSSPHEIEDRLGMSKKAFKRAIGSLYKSGRVSLEDAGVRLLTPE